VSSGADRLQAVRGRFVEELGIEPAQSLRELHEDVLKRAADLRAAIDWSHEMLSDAEQRCFALSAGGWPSRRGETITASGLDTLDGLITKILRGLGTRVSR
jgi:hypothetical protein